jgi:hypothetical protein
MKFTKNDKNEICSITLSSQDSAKLFNNALIKIRESSSNRGESAQIWLEVFLDELARQGVKLVLPN